MILIEGSKINEIKKMHYDAIFPYALSMLNYYLSFFNAIGNNSYLTPDSEGKLVVLETLHHNTLIAASAVLFDVKDEKQKVTKECLKEVIISGKSTFFDLSFSATEAQRLFDLFTKIKNKLITLIRGSVEELQDIVDNKEFVIKPKSIEASCINWVFDYDKFRNNGFKLGTEHWTSYTLTHELNLSVCPYCNRNWIVTVTNESVPGTTKKVVNPQLDHFFSQEAHPLFALSFYNLIPSCETCNARIKRDIPFNAHDYLHPYKNGYGQASRFETIPKNLESQQGNGNNFIVNLIYEKDVEEGLKRRIEKSHSTFQINTIYEQHGDVIADIYRKKHFYSYDYINVLRAGIPDCQLKADELYRLAFGNYYSEKDFGKRPFSKLMKDVIENLGVFHEE